MTLAKTASKRVRKASAKSKRPATKPRRIVKKAAIVQRRSVARSKPRTTHHTAPPKPADTIQENEEALAARDERHGMIEEAIEPPPPRDGHDIERE